MDWATFFKDYPAVIPAVAAVLLAILGYVVGRWTVVENRTFTRRAEIHDKRIKEARDVLEKWTAFLYFIGETTRIMSEERGLKEIVHRFDSLDDELRSIPSMRHEAKIKEPSIEILNDKELSNLQAELSSKLQIPMKNLMVLEENIREIEEHLKFSIEDFVIDDISDITKNMNFDAYGEALQEANNIITKMKIRLDELAKTVK